MKKNKIRALFFLKFFVCLYFLYLLLNMYSYYIKYSSEHFNIVNSKFNLILDKDKYSFLSFDKNNNEKYILAKNNVEDIEDIDSLYRFIANENSYKYSIHTRLRKEAKRIIVSDVSHRYKDLEIYIDQKKEKIKVKNNIYEKNNNIDILKKKGYELIKSSVRSYWNGNYVVSLNSGSIINGKFCYQFLMINEKESKRIDFCYKNHTLIPLNLIPLTKVGDERQFIPLILRFKEGYIVYDKIYFRSLMENGLNSKFFLMDKDFKFITELPVGIDGNIKSRFIDIKGLTLELSKDGCTIILNNVEKAQITNICNLIQDI